MGINNLSTDQDQLEHHIADEMQTMDGYLQRWNGQVGQIASVDAATAGGGGFGDVEILSPEAKLITTQVEEAMKYHHDVVIPVRNKRKLPPIEAHGSTIEVLFGAGQRSLDDTRKGIVVDGMNSGDFAPFENHDLPGGQGGWWCQYAASAAGKMSKDMWVLKSNVNAPEYMLVFPDPRTYQHYLRKMDEHVQLGHPVAPHQAMCLAQFVEYLGEHGGKMPIES
jgi:hypothetical protein